MVLKKLSGITDNTFGTVNSKQKTCKTSSTNTQKISLWSKIKSATSTEEYNHKTDPADNKRTQNTSFDIIKNFPNLPLNENGDIDFENLTVEYLKTLYNENEYTIIEEKNGDDIAITVQKKGENSNVLNYYKYKIEDDTYNQIFIKSALTEIRYINENLECITNSEINNENGILYATKEYWYNKDREVILEATTNKNNGERVEKHFTKGVLYKEDIYTRNKNNNRLELTHQETPLSDELIENITNRIDACTTGIGFIPPTEKLEEIILKYINEDNIEDFLQTYIKKTKRSLEQDLIDNNMHLPYDIQKKLFKHIIDSKLKTKYASKNLFLQSEALGYQVQFALKNGDPELLKSAITQLNKENIGEATNYFYNSKNPNEYFSDYSAYFYTKLENILGPETDNYVKTLGKTLTEYIKTTNGYSKDLEFDLAMEQFNMKKNSIDLIRLLNRANSLRIGRTMVNKPDGKIDLDNIQQGSTGDCWLLAALISAKDKPNAIEKINNAISVDEQGNVTVEFAGINQKYTISAEEIEKSHHLSNGDGDVRAIEIAIDKFKKECAYKLIDYGFYDPTKADINGDWGIDVYHLFFKNSEFTPNANLNEIDFNNPGKAFSISTSSTTDELKATVVNQGNSNKNVSFISRHAYAVLKREGEYLYLINPHNSSEVIKIKQEDLQKLNPTICSCNIDDKNRK